MAENKELDLETADTHAGFFLIQLEAFEWPEFIDHRDRNTLSAICNALETLEKKLPDLSAHAESLLSERIAFSKYEDWSNEEELVRNLKEAMLRGKEWDAVRDHISDWVDACRASLKEAECGPAKKHNFNREAAHIAFEARQLWLKITGHEAPQRGVSATNRFVLFVKILMEATLTEGTGDRAFEASFHHPRLHPNGQQVPK